MPKQVSDAWSRLIEWAEEVARIRLTDGQVRQLRSYVETLQLWNRKIALVSQSDPVEILFKHVADSLFAASACRAGEAVVDLGSGAGFPGIPIAIVHPTSRVCLIESRGRKASFLAEARRVARVGNASIYEGRIESAAREADHCGRYAVVIARALADTETFLAMARPFLAQGGRAIAMRSLVEVPQQARLPGQSIRYELPDGTPRRLLVFSF